MLRDLDAKLNPYKKNLRIVGAVQPCGDPVYISSPTDGALLATPPTRIGFLSLAFGFLALSSLHLFPLPSLLFNPLALFLGLSLTCGFFHATARGFLTLFFLFFDSAALLFRFFLTFHFLALTTLHFLAGPLLCRNFLALLLRFLIATGHFALPFLLCDSLTALLFLLLALGCFTLLALHCFPRTPLCCYGLAFLFLLLLSPSHLSLATLLFNFPMPGSFSLNRLLSGSGLLPGHLILLLSADDFGLNVSLRVGVFVCLRRRLSARGPRPWLGPDHVGFGTLLAGFFRDIPVPHPASLKLPHLSESLDCPRVGILASLHFHRNLLSPGLELSGGSHFGRVHDQIITIDSIPVLHRNRQARKITRSSDLTKWESATQAA